MSPEIFIQSGESQLEQSFSMLTDLQRDCQGGGDDISQTNNGEHKAQARYLPRVLRVVSQMEQDIGIVKLEDVTRIQERQEKSKTFPHPRVKTINGDVHIVSFTQGPQSIQHTSLIGELQILEECQVHIEPHQLISEAQIDLAIRPNQQYTSCKRRYEVMQSPPAFDSGAIHFEDGLSNGEGAVIPHGEEHEHEIKDPHVEVQTDTCQHTANKVDNELEPLILVFVIVLGLLIQNGHVDAPQNDVQVSPRRSRQTVLHL